jgi:nitrite reductase/ring-hydroxylating ferredoxin subunit
MKKTLIIAFVTLLSFSCNKDGDNNQNPYLPNYAFSVDINKNLPSYNDLNFVANPVKVNITGAGIRGLIVMYTGSGYVAYDGACPNQDLSSCSTLTLEDPEAVCPCDNVRYNLFTGLSNTGLPYPLKQYRTEVNGNIIRVYN